MIFNLNKFKGVYFSETLKHSNKKVFAPAGLHYNSKKEIMVEDFEPLRWLASKGMLSVSEYGFLDSEGNIIDLEVSRSDTAFVYVHGLTSAPKNTSFSKRIFEFLKDKNCDIYAPLLQFHETKYMKLFKFNPYIVFERFKKDLEFLLSIGYKRIHFIVFSHGALQTIRASVEGLLDERCILILLCPQLMTRKRMTFIKRGIFLAVRFFAREFFAFEDEVIRMISNSFIKNDFAYILAKNDVYVSYEVESLLREQYRCVKGTTIEECGHFITKNKEFYSILEDYLENIL